MTAPLRQRSHPLNVRAMQRCLFLLPVLALAGCGTNPFEQLAQPVSQAPESAEAVVLRPEPVAPPPPPTARTVEDFDTTSDEDRAEAAAPPEPAAEQSLGTTVASLGDPTQPGFWLETPLVTETQRGRVAFNGKSAQVDLIPIDGETSAGSRISLAAMRLIEAPLTDLPTVEVFAGGPDA